MILRRDKGASLDRPVASRRVKSFYVADLMDDEFLRAPQSLRKALVRRA